mmetsp:Transcript_25264/g.31855  ORF Transcript_25264/g.31855 Transcript_25264/m.31855 type:complete len:216 (-) Transcript_25264:845-1492(-)
MLKPSQPSLRRRWPRFLFWVAPADFLLVLLELIKKDFASIFNEPLFIWAEAASEINVRVEGMIITHDKFIRVFLQKLLESVMLFFQHLAQLQVSSCFLEHFTHLSNRQRTFLEKNSIRDTNKRVWFNFGEFDDNSGGAHAFLRFGHSRLLLSPLIIKVSVANERRRRLGEAIGRDLLVLTHTSGLELKLLNFPAEHSNHFEHTSLGRFKLILRFG